MDLSLQSPTLLTHTQGEGLGRRPKTEGNFGLLFEVTVCESAWEISLLTFGCTVLKQLTGERERERPSTDQQETGLALVSVAAVGEVTLPSNTSDTKENS